MEQIYTIPINEAFEKSAADSSCGCPFCSIYKIFEQRELELILGASMMEPDVRIKTNESGFCKEHYSMLLSLGKKLPLALILESHLDNIRDMIKANNLLPAVSAKKTVQSLTKLNDSCYICDRLQNIFSNVIDNAAYLFGVDPEFKKKCAAQPYFCLPHYAAFLSAGKNTLKGSQFNEFYKCIYNIESKYINSVKDNISFFVKKFDYRYENEPWGDAKDAVEKALEALTGEYPKH